MNKSQKKDTKTQIMDLAEKAIIQGGYSAFSFRELAAQIGIKSASVHYHFPTKGDLAVSVMRRYKESFANELPQLEEIEATPKQLINGFIDGFKNKIVDNQNMSLCTMLTTDVQQLPDEVKQELAAFYLIKLQWIEQVYLLEEATNESLAKQKANQMLASLHGASILVQATGETERYEEAVAYLRE